MLGFLADMIGADRQRSHDKQMAQNSISWRVEDAKRAGISPLAGLGVQGFQASDVSGMAGTRGDLNKMANADIMKEKAKQERIKTSMMQKEWDEMQAKKPASMTGIKRPPTEMDTPRVTTPEVSRSKGEPLGYDSRGKPYYGTRDSGWHNYSKKSAEHMQQEYGEAGDWVGGALNFLNDLLYNTKDFHHRRQQPDYDPGRR